jgi:hypothetical protein
MAPTNRFIHQKNWRGAYVEPVPSQQAELVTVDELNSAMKELASGIRDGVKSLMADSETSGLLRLGKAVDSRIDQKTAEILDRLDKTVSAQVGRVQAALDARLAALEKMHTDTVMRFEQMIKSLPTPVLHINVPEQTAPVINVAAPNVSVSPEFKSVVNVPQGPAPVFNVPEVKASEVTVQMMPRKGKTIKEIIYDDNSRPFRISEQEEG